MLYHIENEALFAAIDSKGAQLHSLKSRSTKTEYLWQGNPAVWYGQAPVLFPFVGQLKNGSFFYDGREYFMKKHGFARISEFRPLQVQGGCAEFLLESSSETLRCYPFAFSLLLRYELCGSTLTATAQVKNTDEKEMLFS
ncbi:MAG: aldose 1-epimerase family protein, partial [Oscillospiraceae bacterium]|nr:aldose 1-epimerase family protein [Oscillospiraceae bacterium]